ncbi:hypothetical protein K438DRAFT_1833004, partial [Mycena galopus ATCC 62051]
GLTLSAFDPYRFRSHHHGRSRKLDPRSPTALGHVQGRARRSRRPIHSQTTPTPLSLVCYCVFILMPKPTSGRAFEQSDSMRVFPIFGGFSITMVQVRRETWPLPLPQASSSPSAFSNASYGNCPRL